MVATTSVTILANFIAKTLRSGVVISKEGSDGTVHDASSVFTLSTPSTAPNVESKLQKNSFMGIHTEHMVVFPAFAIYAVVLQGVVSAGQ